MMRFTRCAAILTGVTALAGPGCRHRDPPPFQIFVRVESDPGQNVTGATVRRNNEPIGTTGPEGRVMLTLDGTEGETSAVASSSA